MKTFLLAAIISICLGRCSSVLASPTLSYTNLPEAELPEIPEVEGDSESSSPLLADWLDWLLDDIFGWNRGGHHYYASGNNSPGNDLANDSFGYNLDENSFESEFTDGGSRYFFEFGPWDSDLDTLDLSLDTLGYDEMNASPIQTVPAPGALILGCIGTGVIGWLRRYRK